MLIKKEPALIIGAIVALVQIGINVSQGDLSSLSGIGEPVATLVGAFFIRQSVFSESTIREAGLSPVAVKEAASDPQVIPHRGK